jgi:ribosomal protein S18 acetylase RimI-like enzyme
VRRELGDGYELDDDPRRIDRVSVHAWLGEHAYWAKGRSREELDALIDAAQRVVGLYHGERQIGFTRTSSDGNSFGYLADVYVEVEHRGRGLGQELVRFSVDDGPYAERVWLLHTEDAHDLYRAFGFHEPSYKLMERRHDGLAGPGRTIAGP